MELTNLTRASWSKGGRGNILLGEAILGRYILQDLRFPCAKV
ncbi:hypothetical protein BVRB_5g126570 [Beta vulgaris subsp. vulgaris]|uniref:Uncharacterized protein n=1 Tax=Beta vulgaris subsp. vulgaris TaxID=3555 RepID=A0A0J8B952_BETVV|nr:hypothetical protein BVRB_5g126570 [Beta vulgaris subsp. vulgaris]